MAEGRAPQSATERSSVVDARATRVAFKAALLRLAVGAAVGLVAGALIGGVCGRAAMLILRLTSPSSVRGIESDDGFEIGAFTGDTLFLVALTTFAGAFLGAAYVAVRRWLPGSGRPAITAVVLGAVGGAAVIEPGGVDFTLLEPLWLAVALFVALPAAFGAVLAWGVETEIARVAHRSPPGWTLAILLLPLVPVLALGPLGVLAALSALGWVAVRHWPAAGRVWWSTPVTIAGQALGGAGTALAAAVLARDITEIL
jgi:hypothetical protein